MVLSAIVALTLSPALCATLLKPANENISRENSLLGSIVKSNKGSQATAQS